MLATWVECLKRVGVTNFMVVALDEATGAGDAPLAPPLLTRQRCSQGYGRRGRGQLASQVAEPG